MRRSRSRRRLIMGAVVAIAVASIAAISLAVMVYSSQPSTSKSRLYPWAFTGAYAEYLGSATYQGIRLSVNHTLQVLFVNATKAEIMTITNDTVPPDPSQIDHKVIWVPMTRSDDTTQFLSNNEVVATRHDTSILIGGQIVEVTAYSVRQPAQGNLTYVNFVSKALNFPVEYRISMNGMPSIDLMLTKTNIPGLLP